ncbi:CAP (Cysteine-rich secretory proteins [Striga asiatica]|uniref:CAP (Cysteine-rich secretory proteins) n=1 Tax=Striga asiatica TaxID=4170 RepID=A0A5A7PPJ5_STRAF|nr:CAP (Cysteine-rich secretory proteins [Striga asiatica]
MDSMLIKKPKALPKPLLLKDYLLDDMSSCSSNGFKSFPRRQCCTSTVRFLVDLDHGSKRRRKFLPNFDKIEAAPRKSPAKSAAIAALRRIFSAVKRLPFASEGPPESKDFRRSTLLPRNLSRKIFERGSFWKRKSSSGREEVGRLKSFDQLMKEDSQPSDVFDSCAVTAAGNGGNEFASGNVVTATTTTCEVDLDLPNDAVVLVKNGDVSTGSTTSSNASSTATDASTKNKQWSVSEDKEQFSPVSVLDCPFDDDDEVSSPYRHRLDCTDETQKKLVKKMKRFGCLEQLEPVSLAKQFESPTKKTVPEIEDEQLDEEEDENRAQQKALNLLNEMENSLLLSPGIKMKADKLLLDFFKEKIINKQKNTHSQNPCGGSSFEKEILDEAENWVNERKPRELFLGWEVERNRAAYVKDMEKSDEWRSFDRENDEVALELEGEVLSSLMNELLVDISSKTTV